MDASTFKTRLAGYCRRWSGDVALVAIGVALGGGSVAGVEWAFPGFWAVVFHAIGVAVVINAVILALVGPYVAARIGARIVFEPPISERRES